MLMIVIISEGKISAGKMLVRPTPAPIVTVRDVSAGKYIVLAIADLSNKLKIEKEKIELISVDKKEWSNSSLGCPEENKMYIEMIVPGFIITLNLAGQNYIYHAGLERIVSCN